MKNLHRKIAFVSILLPSFAIAQTLALGNGSSTFRDFIINDVIGTIAVLIPILIALAFVVFFWGLSKFILHSDNKNDIDKGRNYMFWGIIVLFILVSFRAIISYVVTDLGFSAGRGGIFAPQLPTNLNTPPTP